MTEQQIQQRLLEAALLEDISFPEGMEERLTTVLSPAPSLQRKRLRTGAAAAVIVATAIPAAMEFLRPAPSFTDTCLTAAEARAELQSALASIKPQTASGDLMEMVKAPLPPSGHLPLPQGEGSKRKK